MGPLDSTSGGPFFYTLTRPSPALSRFTMKRPVHTHTPGLPPVPSAISSVVSPRLANSICVTEPPVAAAARRGTTSGAHPEEREPGECADHPAGQNPHDVANARCWHHVVCAVTVLVALFALTQNVSVASLGGGAGHPAEGHLVLVGGGPTPAQVFRRTLALSGGRSAIVAVLPQTYPTDSIADTAVAMWTTFHPREVVKISRTDSSAARDALERATLIWMPGGYQGLLMHTLAGTAIPDIIRARFAAGITIGGASAGAAAMSSAMIADETTPDGDGTGGAATEDGMGLWPEAIVSPHFTERRRLGPLVAHLREHASLFGVGIDEGTAVIVSGGEFEVLGLGTVVIVDSVHARGRTLRSGSRFRYRASAERDR
jgi:cyanophycinase